MFPFVSGVEQLRAAKQVALEAAADLRARGITVPSVPIGVMIEIPAAAHTANLLAREVDFFNDRHERPDSIASRSIAPTNACRASTSRCTVAILCCVIVMVATRRVTREDSGCRSVEKWPPIPRCSPCSWTRAFIQFSMTPGRWASPDRSYPSFVATNCAPWRDESCGPPTVDEDRRRAAIGARPVAASNEETT